MRRQRGRRDPAVEILAPIRGHALSLSRRRRLLSERLSKCIRLSLLVGEPLSLLLLRRCIVGAPPTAGGRLLLRQRHGATGEYYHCGTG